MEDRGLRMVKKIRCFVIADDYKWHVMTDSIEEFREYSKAYLELMNSSQKENHYYFKNVFLTPEEFIQTQKNMAFQNGKLVEFPKNEISRNHLRLVD